MKEEFKKFVQSNPVLVGHVNHGEMSWQKFYEMFELYGANHTVWNDYKEKVLPNASNDTKAVNDPGQYNLNDVVNYVKKMDSNKVKGHINQAQKFLGVLQDFVGKDTVTKTPKISSYIPRPIYRHFED